MRAACVHACVNGEGLWRHHAGAVGPLRGARVGMCIGKEECESDHRHGPIGLEVGRGRNKKFERGQKE